MRRHAFIPDTQAKPGVPNDHLRWIGEYLAEEQPDVIVHAGDHYDLPSLSSYDKGKKRIEGRRYIDDIDAGNHAWTLLNDPIQRAIDTSDWRPTRVRLLGNHEDRITRACEEDAQLDGLLSLELLESPGWEVHDFLEPVAIDGIVYAHYFYNPMTGRPLSGENLKLRLKTLGHSFSMGHQQTFDYAIRYVNGHAQHGLVAGACYQHNEDYKGPQGNAHWRGIIMKNQVEDGAYDIMPVSLDYLCRRYTGHRLADHKGLEL